MAANPAQQQAMQDALNQHHRIKKSTELPLFFGRKDKDSISAKLLVERVDTAGQIATWDAARKCAEFNLILRDRATIWWQSLEDADINKQDWDAVKTEFLEAYEPKFTAKTTCTNFQELIQKQGETVLDYYLRVQEAFTKMCEAKPAALEAVRADQGTATPAQAMGMKKEGIKDTERFFKHQLFKAGLRDDLRSEVMKAGKDTLQESKRLAIELEVINNDKKGRQIAAVQQMAEEGPNDDDDNLQEDEVAYINAMRHQKGRAPFRGNNFRPRTSNGSNGNSGGQKDVVCRYCQAKGHYQKDCRKRLKWKAPMVDANGKPYEKKKIFAVNEENPGNKGPADSNSIATVKTAYPALNALNW